MNIDILKI